VKPLRYQKQQLRKILLLLLLLEPSILRSRIATETPLR
jgi:hypothetical protein